MTTHDEKPGSIIATLEQRKGKAWEHLEACAAAAVKQRSAIDAALQSGKVVGADCVFVTFGSLARDEYTEASDIDWTLLVDGMADPQHLRSSQQIGRLLEQQGGKPPGPTAVFGGLAFSHELIHMIGGDSDSNKNTTRRILLLLESRAIGANAGVRIRVLQHIFRRYLEEDPARHDRRPRVPSFLLNDIARFWRTMAVDYAAKRRERAGSGWAIRNFKLRMSRKLIFASGLAMCLSCELLPSEGIQALRADSAASEWRSALEAHLLGFADRTPLVNLAQFAARFGAEETIIELIDSYDSFLGMLRDPAKRSDLDGLGADEAMQNATFGEARRISKAFHESLIKLFFSTDQRLTATTQRYGVF